MKEKGGKKKGGRDINETLPEKSKKAASFAKRGGGGRGRGIGLSAIRNGRGEEGALTTSTKRRGGTGHAHDSAGKGGIRA